MNAPALPDRHNPKGFALLPADFSTTGFHARTTGAPLTRFQVLGERSSGTNFIKRLLGRNSALRPTESLGWKHGFPAMMAIPADLAVICVLRHPQNWALSMHAKPWHTPPHMQALAFGDFIRAPWDTIIDRARYFDGADPMGLVGQPLQQDRDPVTGATFANLFALRRAKMAGLLSYLNRGCSCVVLRMEDAQADPETATDHLLNALGQPARDAPFRPVIKRLGSKFKPAIDTRPQTPPRMTPADREFMRGQLDLEYESSLGYSIAP